MENGRTYIVGDIHGCLDMLQRMMDRLDWNPDSDRLIFLGDYVDRGADSRGVVDLVLEIARSSPNVQCLMGNHEAIFLDFLEGVDFQTFHFNGGGATLASYRAHRKSVEDPLIPRSHVDFLHSLLPWIDIGDYYVVHAGFRPGVPLEEQTREDLTWIREPFIFSDFDFGKPVIFGHTPFAEPLIMGNKIGLDTGAVFGNKLTCLELPGRAFHFVEA